MDKVNFSSVEYGADLILSLSFDEGTEFGVEGFIIQRDMLFEHLLDPGERGPCIDWTDDDIEILVKRVELSKNTIKIDTQESKYEFDISRLSEKDVKDIKAVLKKMNFDDCFELELL